jgi:hypothetical protein
MEEKTEQTIMELFTMFMFADKHLDEEARKQLVFAMKRCHGVEIARTVFDTLRTCQIDQCKRENALNREQEMIVRDMPPGTTTEEACRIKAAQGDPMAIRHLKFLESTGPDGKPHGEEMIDIGSTLYAEMHRDWTKDEEGEDAP